MQLPRTSTSTTTWPWDMTLSPGFDDMTQARNAQFAANLPPVIMNPNDDPMAAMAEDPEYRREVRLSTISQKNYHQSFFLPGNRCYHGSAGGASDEACLIHAEGI